MDTRTQIKELALLVGRGLKVFIAVHNKICDKSSRLKSKETAFRNALKVKVDRALALQRGSMVISGSACGNGFLIKDCRFSDVRSRGLLIKASRGVIEGNTVANCRASALQVPPEYEWAEGGCSSDLRIENNTFSAGKGCPVWIGGFSGARTSLPANSHKDILISGNTIKTGSCAIERCPAGSGLAISGNKIETQAKRSEEAIRLRNVLDVTQSGNEITLRPLAKRDFRPRLVDVTVGDATLYEDGKEARTIEIDGLKPMPFKIAFVNAGTETAPCSAQMFLQFDAKDGKRLLDAGGTPSVSTMKWGTKRPYGRIPVSLTCQVRLRSAGREQGGVSPGAGTLLSPSGRRDTLVSQQGQECPCSQ